MRTSRHRDSITTQHVGIPPVSRDFLGRRVKKVDILGDLLDRTRLSGTSLFHYELSRPWCLALPRRPDAVFHYLSRGSAIIEFEDGQALPMSAGDLVVVTRGDPHVMWSGRRIKPLSLLDLDRRPAHLGMIHHGGGQQPFSTVICGFFSLSRPLASSILDLLPPRSECDTSYRGRLA